MNLPPGLRLIADFVSADEERALLAAVDSAVWSDALKRRTQHYGYRYVYGQSRGNLETAPPLPPWVAPLVGRLTAPELFPRPPEQLIVNEYAPGQGISKHIDSPVFGEPIASLSLGGAVAMVFRRARAAVSLILPPRSLLLLGGEARHLWTHEIPARRSDVIDGATVARERRVSLTFRLIDRGQ